MNALAFGSVWGAGVDAEAALRHPLVTAPMLEESPRIDGTVGKREWSAAARSGPFVSGTTGERTEEPAWFEVGYTEEAIYLAFRFERPPYSPEPRIAGSAFGSDSVEVLINTEPGSGDDFNFVLDAAGQSAERRRSRGRTSALPWNPEWEAAARTTGGAWEGEMRIPFDSLEVDRPPAGETWRFQVVRNRKTPENELGYWSYQSDWRAIGDFGYLVFGGPDAPAVRISGAGQINLGESGVAAEVVALRAPAQIEALQRILRPDPENPAFQMEVVETVGDDVIMPEIVDAGFYDLVRARGAAEAVDLYLEVDAKSESMEVGAGRLGRADLIRALEPGLYLASWRYVDASTGRLLSAGAVPFRDRPGFELEIAAYQLVARAVGITADFRRMAGVDEGSMIRAELLEPESGEVVAEIEEAASLDRYRNVLQLPLPEEGRFDKSYEVRTRMLNSQGEVLADERQGVELLPRPEWLDNEIGVVEGPLPGWGPIRLEAEDLARVDLRDYRLGASGLPTEITSRDKRLLVAPITLTLQGEEPDWTRGLLREGEGKTVWESTAEKAGLRWTLTTTLEFDGLLRYDLKLEPTGDSAELRNLVLDIPYRKEYASVQGSERVEEDFVPWHEVGDFDTGLFWFCEWAKGWQIGELPPLEVRPDGESLDWKIRFVGKEGKTIEEPLELTWGLQALPVRKLDRSAQYGDRRLYRGPSAPGGGLEMSDLSDTFLAYPTEGLLNPEQGAIVLRVAADRNRGLNRLGEGGDALVAGLERSRRTGYSPRIVLYRGDHDPDENSNDDILGEIRDYIQEDEWLKFALSWRERGGEVEFELVTERPDGQIASSSARIPAEDWRKILAAEEWKVGGQRTIAVDSVVVLNEAPAATALAAEFDRRPTGGERYTLIDPIGDIRFHRGKYLTRPLGIAVGKGGVAGGRYGGSFVEAIKGDWGGAAVLLPAGGERTASEYAQSYNVDILFRDHEQWNDIVGYYGTAFSPNPAFREHVQRDIRDHWRIMFYGDMGFEPNFNRDVGPYMHELRREPVSRVRTALHYDADTPAIDYYLWAWKRTIDYYGVNSIHMDNTINARHENFNIFTGHGWYDDEGTLRGRFPIFGAREAMKRFYWLHHVYIDDGFVSLHAGARRIPPVSGFSDVHQGGEGRFFMTGEVARTAILPEKFSDGYQYRYGVPVEILTKRGRQDYSPNYVYNFVMLYDMSLRSFSHFISPTYWYANPGNPSVRSMGEYAPYFAEPGVSEQSTPQMLWWMLKDEFGTEAARFVGFWDSHDWLRLNDDRLRSSFYLHEGDSALFVVVNFNSEPREVELTLNLAAMGLDGEELTAFDAFTDEDYRVEGNRVYLTIPENIYRLVRVERKR